MEYDRIRGILAHSNVVPFATQASLMNRRDKLKQMGAQALGCNSICSNVYRMLAKQEQIIP